MKGLLMSLPYMVEVNAARMALAAFGDRVFRFPTSIRIESTNACNGRCTMCPRQRMKRRIGVMEFDVFTHIVDQIPRGRRTIHVHNFGEPLLDELIFEKIHYSKSKGFRTRMFSNLNVLNEAMAKELIRSGLDDLKVSIDAARKETYESIRIGLCYDTLVRNLETLMELRKSAGSATPKISVLFIDMKSNREELDNFMAFWKGRVDNVLVTKMHNWAGVGGGGARSGGGGLPCIRLWKTATVLWNGDVVPCCMDYDGHAVLGNAKERSLKEILSSRFLRELKNKHIAGKMDEITLCRTCELRR